MAAPFAAGAVLLLRPGALPPAARPLYMAVLDAPAPGLALAAPFGPFAHPAVPRELLVPKRPLPLRVLCVWNARLVPAAALREAWPCGRLRPEELRAAAVLLRCGGGNTPPQRLAGRVGPPLSHPADPRRVYLRREEVLMDLVRGGRAGGWVFPSLPPRSVRRGLVREAAEGTAAYGRVERFRVDGTPYSLRLVCEQAGAAWELRVEAGRGETDDALDGWLVVGAETSCVIRGGRAGLPFHELRHGLLLLTPSGRAVGLST
jgi:hypothetical protein